MNPCREEVDSDDPAQPELIRAQDVLAREKIPFLHVSVRNTTGLRGKHWRNCKALVSKRTLKEREGHSG